jgi:hypothetical protein
VDSDPARLLSEVNPHAAPELIVVPDVVDVIEEQPAFHEEVHRMPRVPAERNAEVHQQDVQDVKEAKSPP